MALGYDSVLDDDDSEVDNLLNEVLREHAAASSSFTLPIHSDPPRHAPNPSSGGPASSPKPDWLRPSASFPKGVRLHRPPVARTSTMAPRINPMPRPILKRPVMSAPSTIPARAKETSSRIIYDDDDEIIDLTQDATSVPKRSHEILHPQPNPVVVTPGPSRSSPPEDPRDISMELDPPMQHDAQEDDHAFDLLSAFGRLSLATMNGLPPFLPRTLPWTDKGPWQEATATSSANELLDRDYDIKTWIPCYSVEFDILHLTITNPNVPDAIEANNVASSRCQLFVKKGLTEYPLYTTRVELFPKMKIAFPSHPIVVPGPSIKALGTNSEPGPVTVSVMFDHFTDADGALCPDGIGGVMTLEGSIVLVPENGRIDVLEDSSRVLDGIPVYHVIDRTTKDLVLGELSCRLSWFRSALPAHFPSDNASPQAHLKPRKKLPRPIRVTFRHDGERSVHTVDSWTCPLCVGLAKRNDWGPGLLEEHMRREHEGTGIMWRISEADSHVYLTTDVNERMSEIQRPSTPPDERLYRATDEYDTRAPPGGERGLIRHSLLKRHNFGRQITAFEELLQQGAHTLNWESRKTLKDLLSGKAYRNPGRQVVAVMWLAYMQREGLPPRGDSHGAFLQFLKGLKHPSELAWED